MRSGVEGIPWKHGPPARDTSARAGVTAFGPGRWCDEHNLVGSAAGMSRALLKLSGSLVHDYATISDDSPSPNRASRARRAATSAGIS